jgi:hypothetical protein
MFSASCRKRQAGSLRYPDHARLIYVLAWTTFDLHKWHYVSNNPIIISAHHRAARSNANHGYSCGRGKELLAHACRQSIPD